jgi:hypothetical protein
MIIMKKRSMSMLLIFAALLILLTACDSDGPAGASSDAEVSNAVTAGQNLQNEQQSNAAATATPTTNPPKPTVITDQYLIDLGLPVYVPGSINVKSAEEVQNYHEYPFHPTMREVYYGIEGVFQELVENGSATFIFDNSREKYGNSEPKEMPLAMFLKHYQVSKGEFEAALVELQRASKELGHDVTDEMWELPNADIIYTFDNEIINYYYRRA